MASGPSLATIEAPYRGLDTVSGPLQIPATYSPELTNVLTGRQGSLPARGGMHRSAPLSKPYSAVWSSRVGKSAISVPGDTTVKILSSTWTLSNLVAASADHVPTGPYTQVGDTVYGIGATGFFLRWDAAAGTITKYANAPSLGYDVVYWLERLWYLGGKLPGDAAARTDQLGWSDQVVGSTALPDLASAWQDDVSALTNRIVLDSVSGSNPPVGLGVLPSALAIFGANSVDLLVGSSPANVSLRPRVSSHGCVDKRTIVNWRDTVIWLAPEGLFMFDGAQEEELSSSIRNVISDVTAAVKAAAGSVSATLLPNDYLMLVSSVPITTVAGGNTRNAWLLHLPTRTWSYMASAAITDSGGLYGFVGTQGAGSGHGFLCGSHAIWDLDNIAQVLTTTNMFGQELMSDGVSTIPFSIEVFNRNRPLAGPLQKAKISRIAVDALGGGLVLLREADGTIVQQQSLPFTAVRSRTAAPVFMESTELAVQVVIGGDTVRSELYDMYVEYAPAQQSGSF